MQEETYAQLTAATMWESDYTPGSHRVASVVPQLERRYSRTQEELPLTRLNATLDVEVALASVASALLNVAELCARAGRHKHASRLLMLHAARQPPAAYETEAANAALGVLDPVEASTVWPTTLCIVLMIARPGLAAPFSETLAHMLDHAGTPLQSGMSALLRVLDKNNALPHSAFAPGAVVLAVNTERETWEKARILRVLDDGRKLEIVRGVGGFKVERLASEVLRITTSGLGALLRAAAAAPLPKLVASLLDVSTWSSISRGLLQECDADANVALHHGAAAGSPEVCRLLVDAGVDPWCFNRAGSRPFFFAQQKGNTMARRAIKPSDSDLEFASSSNFGRWLPSLLVAARHQQSDELRELLSSAPPCYTTATTTTTTTTDAAEVVVVVAAERRVQRNHVNLTSPRGCCALGISAEEGWLEGVELLLEAAADVNQIACGFTPVASGPKPGSGSG